MTIAAAKGATPISFLIGGLIALVTAYFYLGLTLRYPGPGGTVSFITKAFGSERHVCAELLIDRLDGLLHRHAGAKQSRISLAEIEYEEHSVAPKPTLAPVRNVRRVRIG